MIDAFEGKLLPGLEDEKSLFSMKRPEILEILELFKIDPSF
jgi:hypothetical protein